MAVTLASSPLVHLTASLPRPMASAPASTSSRWGCLRGVCLDWRPKVVLRALRRCDRLRCFSINGGSGDSGGGEDGEKRSVEEAAIAAAPVAEVKVGGTKELGSKRSRLGSFSLSSLSGTPGVSSRLPLHSRSSSC